MVLYKEQDVHAAPIVGGAPELSEAELEAAFEAQRAEMVLYKEQDVHAAPIAGGAPEPSEAELEAAFEEQRANLAERRITHKAVPEWEQIMAASGTVKVSGKKLPTVYLMAPFPAVAHLHGPSSEDDTSDCSDTSDPGSDTSDPGSDDEFVRRTSIRHRQPRKQYVTNEEPDSKDPVIWEDLPIVDAAPRAEHYVDPGSVQTDKFLQHIARADLIDKYFDFIDHVADFIQPPMHSPHYKQGKYPSGSEAVNGCHGPTGKCDEKPGLFGLYCEGCFDKLSKIDQLGLLNYWVGCGLHKVVATDLYAGNCKNLRELCDKVTITDQYEGHPRLLEIVQSTASEDIDF